MFFPLASCMFFLPVISFVHRCLPLAVPVCPQSSISLPSIRWDFLFTWLIPSRYIPAQSRSPCAAVAGNAASREGTACCSSLGGDPLESSPLHPAVPGSGQRLWAKAVRGCRGASLLPFLCARLLQQSREIPFFPRQRGWSAPCCRAGTGVKEESSGRGEMPVPGAGSSGGVVLLEQPAAAGRSGCGGGGSTVRTVQRWAGKWAGWLEARWTISEQEGGEGFLCSLIPLELSLV